MILQSISIQNDENFMLPRKRDSGLLGPLKQLSKKLNNDFEYIDALINERKENTIQRDIRKYLSQTDQVYPLEDFSKHSVEMDKTPKANEFVMEESQTSKLNNREEVSSFKSPPYIKMKTMKAQEMSPNQQDTIEISEDYLLAGGNNDQNSESSFTPSEFKNGKLIAFSYINK